MATIRDEPSLSPGPDPGPDPGSGQLLGAPLSVLAELREELRAVREEMEAKKRSYRRWLAAALVAAVAYFTPVVVNAVTLQKVSSTLDEVESVTNDDARAAQAAATKAVLDNLVCQITIQHHHIAPTIPLPAGCVPAS